MRLGLIPKKLRSIGIVLDFDAAGQFVGLDIDHASQVVDIARLETDLTHHLARDGEPGYLTIWRQ